MNKYDLWFCQTKISNKYKIELLKKFNNSEEIWYYIINGNKFYDKTINVEDIEKFEKINYIINKENIKYVTYFDKKYPNKLKNYDDAPYILFYKGDISGLDNAKNVSVVGARRCTNYGIQCTNYIVKQLAINKINIISGMAYGIDSYAHNCCIKNNSYTCAVLGSGIDVIYPKCNKNLYDEIINNGCVISEFLPGTPPYSYNFPVRNRIISALCDILIVIEASKKSGSLITANYALAQGKDIVAVPGSIFSDKSIGTNLLINDGAFPYTNINNIFKLLHLDLKDLNTLNKNNRNKFKLPTYKKIYELIGDSPIYIDDLLRRSNIDITLLYELLFEMQFKNEIICLSGNYYVRNHNY